LVTCERIAELTCMSVKAVQTYSELWFDVRDRFDDLCFIANIVYPDTRQVEFMPDYYATVQPEQLLLRAAHNTEDVDVVLQLFGAVSAGARLPEDELIKMLRVNILAEAAGVAQVGCVHQKLPILDRAMKIITADIKALSRIQAPATRVVAQPMATKPMAPGSLLESIKTTMAADREKAQLSMVPLTRKGMKSSQCSRSSHRSRRSHSFLERKGSIPGSERKTTIWIKAADGVRTADAELFPKSDGDSLEENLFRIPDSIARLDEGAIINK